MNSFYKGGSELPTGKGSSCSNQIKSKKLWPLVFKLVVLFRLYFNSIPPVRIKHSLSTDIVLITQNLRKKIRQGKTYFKDTSVLLKNRCKISAQNQIKTAGSSSSLRVLFEDPSTLRRTNVASSSGMLRLLFDCASGRSRGVAEALPKPSQRAPEPVSTMSQRSLEAEPKVSRRGEEVSPSSVFCLTNFAQASAFHAVCLEFSSGSHRVAPIKTRCRPDENPMKCKNSAGIAQKMVDYSLAQETHKLDYSATLGSPLLSPCYTQGQLNDCTSPTQQKEAFQEGGESRLTYGVESEQSVLRCFKPTCKAFVFRVNTLLGSIDPVVQRALKYFLFLANYELTYRMVLACIHLWIVFQSSNFSFKALKNKQALFILVCLFHMFSLSAQTPRKDSGADGPLQALQIGSTLPNEAIAQISAHNIKGHKQLYILDFWTTWCGACLASFPHLSSLQRKFNADIQIILLNAQETQENANIRIQRIANNNPALKVPELPQIYNARLFDSLFPHLSVPHHIWVDRDFKVIAITKGENTNEKNINSYLKTQRIDLPTKFELMDFEEDKSLLSEGGGRQQNLLIGYSLLLDSIYGAPSLFKLSKKGTPSLRIVNRSLLDLFKIAYGMANNQWASNPFRSPANIELNGRPLETVESKDIPAWLYRKYCYENKTVSNDNSVYTVMQQDLKRFFDINASVQVNSVNGWMLEIGSTQQAIKYEKGYVFKSISQLQSYLNEAYAAIGPFYKGVQIDAAIEIVLPRKVLGKEELFNSLKQQGVICKPNQVKKQILQLTYKD